MLPHFHFYNEARSTPPPQSTWRTLISALRHVCERFLLASPRLQVSAISPTKCYLLLTKNLNTRSNPIIDIFEGLIKRAFTHLDPVGNSPLIKLLNSFLGISSNMQPNQPPIWFQDLLLSWYSYSRG